MAGVLRLLDRQEADPDERLIIEAVRQWLTNSPRWLLIFDNVCDLRALRQVLPVQGSGDMLFTTRDSDTARSLANPEADFEVKRLGPDHAVEMVGKLLKEDILDAEMTASARALHQLVDGLPIAIEQTVTLASLRRVTLATILQQLQSRRQDVMDQGYQTSLHETHSSTGALFAMATESLAARHPEAAALFKVMIYLDTSAIAIEMLQEGSSRLSQHFARTLAYDRGAIRSAKEEELRATRKARVLDTDPRDYLWYPLRIRHDFLNLFRNREPPQKVGRADSTYDSSLQKYVAEEQHLHDVLEKTNRIDHALLDLQTAGLIQIYNSRMVWIHDLVRDLNVEMLAYKAKPLHQANSHLAMMLVYLAFPVPRPTSYFDVFDKCTLYLPHALSVLHHSVDFSFDTTVGPDLMHITASTLDTHRQSNPGGIEQSAKYWYYRAYAGYMKSWARLRQQVSDIETAREARNDFNAELRGACFARITTRYERFGQAPRRAIDTALKLGCVAAREKDYIDARKWINAAVNGYEKLLGPYHDLTIDSMSFLVTIYIEMGAFEEGVEIAIKRSELHKARFGPLSQSTDGAGCAAQLGCLYRKLGHQDVALEWYQLALKGQESVYGTESEFLCGTLLIIAGLLRELRRWQNAVECASRAHVLLQADGEASLRLNEVRCELALCLEGVGKPEEAKVSLGTALRSILPVNADYRQLQDFVKPLALKAAWDLVRLGTAGELNTELRDVVTKEMIKEAEEIHGALGQDSSGIISSETATNTMDAVESPDSITPVS
ncbi:MAG: hypothetical protein M1830_000306 [Pleopsidium flavum]|nr:MAG: hypothetical protein M1830_000306 [Pleopsidium flavum]